MVHPRADAADLLADLARTARAGFLIVHAKIRIPDHEIETVAERLNHACTPWIQSRAARSDGTLRRSRASVHPSASRMKGRRTVWRGAPPGGTVKTPTTASRAVISRYDRSIRPSLIEDGLIVVRRPRERHVLLSARRLAHIPRHDQPVVELVHVPRAVHPQFHEGGNDRNLVDHGRTRRLHVDEAVESQIVVAAAKADEPGCCT